VVLCDAPEVAEQIRRQHGAPCEEIRIRGRYVPAFVHRALARRALRAHAVDLVHINYVRPWHELWSRMDPVPPYVVTAWGSDLNDEIFPKPPAHTRAVDRVLSRAAGLTADSLPLLEKAVRRSGRPDIPASLVLWGVDLSSFDVKRAAAAAEAWRARLAIPDGLRVVLSPRQNRPHYHVDRILRAFAACRSSRDAVLVIKLYARATDAEDRARLEALAASLGVRGRVRFAPACPYPELPGLYALADVAVSALEVDGFPSTFCELLALGVPLVATDLPPYRGALADGDSALLVPAGDHAPLAAALDRLADDPALVARLRERGAAWARENADWSACVDRFEAVYRAALARR
jgi:glycosyltransferase involved in cell wall biosynthesis